MVVVKRFGSHNLERPTPSPSLVLQRQGAWYQVEVEVPPTALCLDAVFTDGSGAWDNNDRRDFHAPLSGAREALGVLKLASAMKRFRAWQVATAEARQLEIVRQVRLGALDKNVSRFGLDGPPTQVVVSRGGTHTHRGCPGRCRAN